MSFENNLGRSFYDSISNNRNKDRFGLRSYSPNYSYEKSPNQQTLKRLKNRKFRGIEFCKGSQRNFQFSSSTNTVKKSNQLFYLPKYSQILKKEKFFAFFSGTIPRKQFLSKMNKKKKIKKVKKKKPIQQWKSGIKNMFFQKLGIEENKNKNYLDFQDHSLTLNDHSLLGQEDKTKGVQKIIEEEFSSQSDDDNQDQI